MEKKLIDVINHSRSVVELYLSKDFTQITEVNCLSGNKIKEYNYSINDFLKRREVPRYLKNKVVIAMAQQ